MVDLSASCPAARPLALEVETNPLGYDTTDHGALKEAIAARYERATPDDVVLGAGASEVLAALAHALVEPGVTVACASGSYPAFVAGVDRCGGRLVGPDEPADVVAFCNPTNPEGRRVDIPRVRAAVGEHAVLVVDEVYRDLTLGEPILAASDIDTRAVSVNDLSKPLGLGGLRIGWAVMRDHELRERVEREVALLSGGLSVLSVRAALIVFREFDEWVAAAVDQAREKAPAIYRALSAAGWSHTVPEAGLTIIATPPRPLEEGALERVHEAGLFVLPGETVGADGGLRISLLAEVDALSQALAVLAERQPLGRSAA